MFVLNGFHCTCVPGRGPLILSRSSPLKKGGSAEAVDYKGLLNTGQACVDLGIPRLVVISR